MPDIFFLILDPSHLKSGILFFLFFSADSTLYLVWQRRSCEKTASKQEVLALTPAAASAGLCGIPVLLHRHKHASWVSFQVLPLTAVLTQHLDLALKMTGSSFTVRGCTFFSLTHIYGLCWLITPIYEVMRHKYIHETLNTLGKGKWIEFFTYS